MRRGILDATGGNIEGKTGTFDDDANAIWEAYLRDVQEIKSHPATTFCMDAKPFQVLANSVWGEYVDDLRLGEFSLNDNFEVRTRFPVTQEFMVKSIVAARNGESTPHPALRHFERALHESTDRMVLMIASKYAVNSSDQKDDLAQDCFSRIWAKLDKYDEGRAKFTTWAWHLCSNLLKRKYRNQQKLKSRESVEPFDEIERKAVAVEDCQHKSILSAEFAGAVRELGIRYPKWRDFVYELLGNPDCGIVADKIRLSRAASITGVEKEKAKYFFKRIVQPFLSARFS
jgi:RNA polymerase sigma factor (sigma-70 family)